MAQKAYLELGQSNMILAESKQYLFHKYLLQPSNNHKFIHQVDLNVHKSLFQKLANLA